MYLRKAVIDDLPEIIQTIEDGRQALSAKNIPQWQNGDGPNQELLRQDINQENCYVLIVEKQLAGVGVLISEKDSAYENISEGKWLPESLKHYTAIHRVALKQQFQGNGLAKHLLEFLITAACLQGALDIRIDTHPENQVMQHLIHKTGFSYQGQVLLPVTNGERYAYQLILS